MKNVPALYSSDSGHVRPRWFDTDLDPLIGGYGGHAFHVEQSAVWYAGTAIIAVERGLPQDAAAVGRLLLTFAGKPIRVFPEMGVIAEASWQVARAGQALYQAAA